MDRSRQDRHPFLRRCGVALAMACAALAGFVAAGLVFAGPARLKEMTPVGAVRSLTGRGRDADAPQDIPLTGWADILRRTAAGTVTNRLMAQSAAVTFYALLALFPALTATVSLYGLFADPKGIQALVGSLAGVLPEGGIDILHGQLQQLIQHGPRGLTAGVALGLAATLWSANQGSKALFDALNVVYREREKRSYPYFVLVSMLFTLAAIVFVLAAMVGVVALPMMIAALRLSPGTQSFIGLLRWPIILVVVGLFLSNLYRFGPSREDPKWRWVTWGGFLAAISWAIVSSAFSWYVQRFGNFDRIYGSLGAVVGFMVWIWLSTLVALCGAQLDSEMEHQTGADTTTGPPRPLGLRGATQSDTVA